MSQLLSTYELYQKTVPDCVCHQTQDMFSCHVSKGILTPLFAATHPKAELLNGKVRHSQH